MAAKAPAAKKPYHREHLRRDLLDAGRRYVATKGYHSLSMRELAQEVGVSPGAPYHHFADRRSFLLAIASEAFEELIARASRDAGANGRVRLSDAGMSFIAFSVENPFLVELMYESELTTPTIDPALLTYQAAAHATLKEIVRGTIDGLDEIELNLRVLFFWSATYGFASMRSKGIIHPDEPNHLPSTDIAESIVERAVAAALSPVALGT